MHITGKTELYGLLGYPVEHTASPKMHNAAFKAMGRNAVYVPFSVSPENLEAAVKGLIPLGVKGVNVTIPHKQAIIPYLDSLHPSASAIGAVNTVQVSGGKLMGYNTDAAGFASDVEIAASFNFTNTSVFICGAGGAGRAVAFACLSRGVKKIGIFDVDSQRSKSLVDALVQYVSQNTLDIAVFQIESVSDNFVASAGLAVNATPLGMKNTDTMPFYVERLPAGCVVYDVVYNIPETQLIKSAKERGLKALNGLGMLLGQGAMAFRIWTGQAPDSSVMRAALEEAIYGDTV